MNVDELDYHLPPELIAQEPLADRAASRMLHLDRLTGAVDHRVFRDFPQFLNEGDLLVMNDTRVTAVRLNGQRPTGGSVEALLLKQLQPDLYEAVVKPAKRLKVGSTVSFGEGLTATVTEAPSEMTRLLQFPPGSHEEVHRRGSVPLPPYIQRALADPSRYQTVYSRTGGSAAAPTAGLHFTEEVLDALSQKGVRTAHVTLDVGLDTFRPMAVGDTNDHPMHGETCRISPETAEAVNSCTGRVLAVGTTTVRTLESFADRAGRVRAGSHVTHLLIQPGYQFQVVHGMLTNFHMPRTTMLLMLSALASLPSVRSAYEEAVRHQYRFLSFGDCMLIL